MEMKITNKNCISFWAWKFIGIWGSGLYLFVVKHYFKSKLYDYGTLILIGFNCWWLFSCFDSFHIGAFALRSSSCQLLRASICHMKCWQMKFRIWCLHYVSSLFFWLNIIRVYSFDSSTAELEPLQPLLKRGIGFLAGDVVQSSSEILRPRVQMDRLTIWLGLKALYVSTWPFILLMML